MGNLQGEEREIRQWFKKNPLSVGVEIERIVVNRSTKNQENVPIVATKHGCGGTCSELTIRGVRVFVDTRRRERLVSGNYWKISFSVAAVTCYEIKQLNSARGDR